MPKSKPNIIYVVCHDIGKHMGCYGAQVSSPCLDRFSEEGVIFTNYFCNSPACSPSRGCAMSGQYAHTNGLMGLVNNGWSMPEESRTLVDYLNDAGYETAHFGFQHERYRASANRYQVEENDYPEYDWVDREDEWAERVMSDGIRYLEQHTGSERPFYLNLGTVEVHASRWQGGHLAGTRQDRHLVYGADRPEDVYLPPHMPDAPAVRELFGRFQGAIRYLDSHFQRLMNAVSRLGLEHNTLVVFTTDHGIAGLRAKGTLYDAGVGIALLMRMPGTIPSGVRFDELLQNIDITPTLLDAIGLDIPSGMQGRSFWGLLTGQEYKMHQAIFTERNWHGSYDPMRAVRTAHYHYISNLGDNPMRAWLPNEVPHIKDSFEGWFDELWSSPTEPRPSEELYDVIEDPNEWHNLAQLSEYQEIKDRLAHQLKAWMHETHDPVLEGPIPRVMNRWPTHHIHRILGDDEEKEQQI